MTATRALGLLAMLAAGACTPESQGGGVAWVGQIGPETREGRVRVVGSRPFAYAVLQPEDGEPLVLGGPYEAEIQRLAGAEVLVTGRFAPGPLAEATLEASSYEILSVDGDRPLIGRLEEDDGGFYLDVPSGGRHRIRVISEPLAARVGALVWVVLDDREGVARYGVLREPI